MAEFKLEPQPLPMDEPNIQERYKNVKEFKTSDGTFQIKDGKIEFRDSDGNMLSEWLPSGIRNVYDSSGNIVIQENPNG